jgi:hypothetical protein
LLKINGGILWVELQQEAHFGGQKNPLIAVRNSSSPQQVKILFNTRGGKMEIKKADEVFTYES